MSGGRAAEPMTARQRRYLIELCLRAGRTFEPALSKEAASHLIADLAAPKKRGRRKGAPHGPSRAQARNAPCPHCGALPNENCIRDNGTPRQSHHAARYDEYRRTH